MILVGRVFQLALLSTGWDSCPAGAFAPKFRAHVVHIFGLKSATAMLELQGKLQQSTHAIHVHSQNCFRWRWVKNEMSFSSQAWMDGRYVKFDLESFAVTSSGTVDAAACT